MKRNRDLPLPGACQGYNPQLVPGFLYCRMSNACGFGIGSWEIMVVIDPEKLEYNDNVYLTGRYENNLTGDYVEFLEKNGIHLRAKVLRTILRLYKSEEFRKFTEIVPISRVCDTDYSTFEICDTSDRIYLYMERFNFYKGIAFPRDEYQRSARKWTKGLRGIFKKAYPSYIVWKFKNC